MPWKESCVMDEKLGFIAEAAVSAERTQFPTQSSTLRAAAMAGGLNRIDVGQIGPDG